MHHKIAHSKITQQLRLRIIIRSDGYEHDSH